MALSVLIVNFNAEEALRNCLESLYRNTAHRPLEVIVVDNASSDGSLAMVAREFPQVRVLASQENLGFSRGNNLAIQAASGRYLLLLNNDTLVSPGAVDTMLRLMQERDEVGALGPLLRNADGSVQISYGRMIGFRAEFLQKLLFALSARGNPLIRRYLEWRSRRAAYPDWVSGACIMLRADILREVGLLDENFFMYTEEVDLCQRIRRRGYRVFYTPEAEIVHLGGKSTESNSEKAALEYRRSQLYFYLKHYGRARVRLLKAYLVPKVALAWALGSRARRNLNQRLLRLIWDF
jgi:hypothetical protein